MGPDEATIRAWARDEWEKKEREKQAKCKHALSGTLQDNGSLTCDQCGKILTRHDAHYSDELTSIEQRHVNSVKGI